ncbi:hypothetical protein AMQ83_14720 [Paenibacillus riograndensis]|nr:hypothetical protein AMQ83_14720 [Paenibacillus riograndensis]
MAVGTDDEGVDLLLVASEPMVVNGTDSQVVYSRDGGCRWQAWEQSGIGAVRWKGIAFDCEGRQVLGVSCGNGAFHKRLADKI